MTPAPAFWDSSAVLPLCVKDAASWQVQSLLGKFSLVVWWGTPVEVQCAIFRMVRAKDIEVRQQQDVLTRLQRLKQTWAEIAPDKDVRELALQVCRKHSLRAGDSLQLAAALTWCRQHPAGRHLVCGDRRLNEAAQSEGFSVIALYRR